MKRRLFILGTSAGALASATTPLRAQPSGKAFRIGILKFMLTGEAYWEAFRDELRRLGHVEGKSYVLIERVAGSDPSAIREAAASLVREKVDAIFAGGSSFAAAAVAATKSIPIVVIAGSIVERGYAASLARPGGNVTGIEPPLTISKQIATLKATMPNLQRVAVLDFLAHELRPVILAQARRAAGELGVIVDDASLRSLDDLEDTLARLATKQTKAVLLSPHPAFFMNGYKVASLALKHGLATSSFFVEGAEAGALLAYDPDTKGLWRRAAVLFDKILKGTPPADIPIEQPTRFIFAINLKSAKALGLTIPNSVLAVADRIIE